MTRHIHRKVGQLLPELKEEDEGFYKILSANTANHLCQSCMHAANSYSLRKNNEHVVPSFGLLLHVVCFLLYLSGTLWHAAYHNV